MQITEPHYIELPHPVIFHDNGIRVTHLLEVPCDIGYGEGNWTYLIIHEDDVKKAFHDTDNQIVNISDDKECSSSVLDEWDDYDQNETYAYYS